MKVRQGFVSNSSTSSFIITTTIEIRSISTFLNLILAEDTDNTFLSAVISQISEVFKGWGIETENKINKSWLIPQLITMNRCFDHVSQEFSCSKKGKKGKRDISREFQIHFFLDGERGGTDRVIASSFEDNIHLLENLGWVESAKFDGHIC